MSDLRDAVSLLSNAVQCLTAALQSDGTRREALIREADVCAQDAHGIAQTVNGVAGVSGEP